MMRLWFIVLLATGTFLALPEAARHVPVRDVQGRPKRWQRDVIEMQLVLPQRASSVNAEEALRAARGAASAWRVSGAPRIEIELGSPGRSGSEDGVTAIVLRADGWFSPENPDETYDPRSDALTHLRARPSRERPGLAEIIEADVEVNTASEYFGVRAPNEFGRRLQALLTHEFGHVLGLDHDCSASELSLVRDSGGEPRPRCADAAALRADAMFPGSEAHEMPALRPTEQELLGLAAAYRDPALARVALRLPRRARALPSAGLVAVVAALGLHRRRRRHSLLVST